MPAQSPKNEAASPGINPRRSGKISWRSLNWQLMFITILPVTALVLLVAVGSVSVHQNAMRNMVGERDLFAVRTAAVAIQEQILYRLNTLHSLGVLAEAVDRQVLAGILVQPGYLIGVFDAGLAIYTPQGQLVAVSRDSPLWTDLPTGVQDFIDRQATDRMALESITLLDKDPQDNQLIAKVYTTSPNRQWITAGAFSISSLVHGPLAQDFSGATSKSILLVDSQQGLLYQRGVEPYEMDIDQHPGVQAALAGKSGVLYTQDQQNELVVAYSPINPPGWALVFQEAWELVESPTLRLSQIAPLVLAPVLILAIVALGFGAKQIITPLQNLESKASLLAWGDFEAIETPVGGIDEIRQLQHELIQMAQKVRSSQKNLHSYIGVITSAQEDERLRLARELHDETIQALIALKQRAQLYQLSASQSDSESSALTEIASLTEETIRNLRRLIHDLRPIYLEDLGLATALEMLARETAQTLGIPVDFRQQGSERRLAAQIEMVLFRMAQEAFRNIERHAQATQASLSIEFTDQVLTIEISDNGIGFEAPRHPSEFAPSGHYGLLGLYERADLIGAALEIQSSPGEGTFLRFRIPISSH